MCMINQQNEMKIVNKALNLMCKPITSLAKGRQKDIKQTHQKKWCKSQSPREC